MTTRARRRYRVTGVLVGLGAIGAAAALWLLGGTITMLLAEGEYRLPGWLQMATANRHWLPLAALPAAVAGARLAWRGGSRVGVALAYGLLLVPLALVIAAIASMMSTLYTIQP